MLVEEAVESSGLPSAAARAGSTPKPRFNPFLPGFHENPYPFYQVLRESNPLHRNMGMWIVTRYADVMAVLGDRSFSSSTIPTETKKHCLKLNRDATPDLDLLGAKSIVFTDPPDHTRLRKLVARPFATKACEARRPFIAERAAQLLDRAFAKGEVDFITEFADPLPLHVMADMMNLPEEVRPAIRDWTHRIRFLLEPGLMTAAVLDDVLATLAEYMAYFRGVIAERRERLGDDLISLLIQSRAGEDCLSDEEIIFAGIMTFVAGHETTKCLLGNGMLALLEHPDQLARLQEKPSLIATAVEEMFRFDSPLQQTKRRATRELTLAGQSIKPGDQLLLCLGSANRDAIAFAEPDRFDVGRSDTAHAALGYGLHQCLGGTLAKLEANVAFEMLLRRARSLLPGSGERSWLNHSFIIRGPKSLPMVMSS